MGKYVDKMRIIIIFVIVCAQGTLFFVMKLYFFEKFENEVNNNNFNNLFNNININFTKA